MPDETTIERYARQQATRDYWREFLRVNFDKIVLGILILYMQYAHADERLIYLLIGGLVGAITHNRWQRNP